MKSIAHLSDDARSLLSSLKLNDSDSFGCIVEHEGIYYILPAPDFNWDRRAGLMPACNQEYVDELVNYGYLILGSYAVRDWGSQYSTVWMDHNNKAYTLTRLGEEKVKEILSAS